MISNVHCAILKICMLKNIAQAAKCPVKIEKLPNFPWQQPTETTTLQSSRLKLESLKSTKQNFCDIYV